MTQPSNPYSVRSWFLWVAIPVTIFMAPIIWITHSAHNGDTAMNKDTSGPAFPVTLSGGATYNGHEPFDGMSLRDYLAANAMQGLLACSVTLTSDQHRLASDAYAVADAMLEARSK